MSRRARTWLIFAAGSALLLAVLSWAAGAWASRAAMGELQEKAQASAALHAAVLRSELDKQRSLPFVLAEDPDVLAVLNAGRPTMVSALNVKLERLSQGTRAAVIYVLDARGLTLAASNWRLPSSFVGSNYSFRPYFKGALAQGSAELFALGTVSGRPGLFLARRVSGASGPLGVVVVKVEFDALEAEWGRSADPVFVSDEQGVVLVTSVSPWRFGTVAPLTPAQRRNLSEARQFGAAPLSPLPINWSSPERTGAVSARLPRSAGSADFVAASAPAAVEGWTVHLLTTAAPALGTAAAAGRSTALLAGALAVLGAGVLLRRREREHLREAAQKAARDELEVRVADRTRELSSANERITAEMEERRRAEADRHRLQDELIQAGRLAVLGQIAAGVAHEINQPVAAIRAYADNAQAFLERKDAPRVRDNLKLIAALTERVGVITGELRAFARKSARHPQPTSVEEAVRGALLLVDNRLRAQGVRLIREGSTRELRVHAERIRLEQVLVNLLQNALDALEGRTDGAIRLSVEAEVDTVALTVADNGPGLSPEIEGELFTPFATTKPQGLGLGLVISRDILTEFGGELRTSASPGGGAAFHLVLARTA